MTNEMQLAQAAGLPIVGHEMTGHNGSHKQQQGPQSGFKKVHKLLRGRYPLVITLGLLFGAAGALIGFLSQKPLYRGEFQVEIDPVIRSVNNPIGDPMLMYDRFLQSQVAVLTSYELVQRAMNEDDWKNAGGTQGDEVAMSRFAAGIEADNFPAETTILRVRYSDPDKALAYAGAQSLLKAYGEFLTESDPINYGRTLTELDRMRTQYQTDLADYKSRLHDLQTEFKTDDLSSYQSTNMEELGKLSNELQDATMRLHIDQAQLDGVNGGGVAANGAATSRPSALTEQQIAMGDGGILNAKLREREQYQHDINLLKAEGYEENSPAMQKAVTALQVANQEIQDYVTSHSDFRMDFQDGRAGLTSVRDEIPALKSEIDVLTTQYNLQNEKCSRFGAYLEMINELKNNIDRTQSSLNEANSQYDRLNADRDLNPTQMKLVSSPVAPSEPSTDKRRLMGAVGFFGGALIPTVVVLLISLLDGRFRYSDEANTDLGGVPLLGILPNLPDLLTDPTQAATAAHCVHQIRTILQITGHSTERRVFAITSGSPGDGKTSLTLALGLSFAASGSRTLLVDGDLIGGGLTARLNVNAEHGVLEAMAARDIAPYIRTTDVADLSFLPVGRAMGGYTGTISPAAVRRLVDEARKQFDVILIDTGPILGSIEASPVAVASDGVVLCVSRGQQRQLVDRALAHLHAIGATLAGVVFNRAQAHDFERSTNRLGFSSVPAGTDGRRSEAIGPVARAVASSVRSAAASER